MSERRLNNTIYLMFRVRKRYCAAHNMTKDEFKDFDLKNEVLDYVAECPDVFDCLSEDEMVEEIDEYVS